jgi:hypothetical protein
MVKKKAKTRKSQAPPDAEVLPILGDATTAIFLLRDYEKFGLAERVSAKKQRLFAASAMTNNLSP